MNGIGVIGIADALTEFLSTRFPNFYVYRSYLGLDAADANAARAAQKTAGRIVVLPESTSLDPSAHDVIARQVVCRIVVIKDFDRSTTDDANFAPASEADPLIQTLEEIAELFTEKNYLFQTKDGATSDVYIPETAFSGDAPLYDENSLMQGRFLGSLRVSVFEKFERAKAND